MYSIDQLGLELVAVLRAPHPPKCRDYRQGQMFPLPLGVIPKLKKTVALFIVCVMGICIVSLTHALGFIKTPCKSCAGV